MAGFAVQVLGVPQARGKLMQLEASLRGPAVMRALMAGALIVQTDAKRRAPKLTGTLSRSIHIEPAGMFGGLGAAVDVGTDVIYARIHELGGEITPVNAQYLHFVINGEDIFTKGPITIPARPYLRPALDENTTAVVEAFAAALRAILGAL
jgi:HK97 gp10 family phage protein